MSFQATLTPSNVRSSPSPSRASIPRAADARTKSGAGSTPTTLAPVATSLAVSAPSPQPRSRTCTRVDCTVSLRVWKRKRPRLLHGCDQWSVRVKETFESRRIWVQTRGARSKVAHDKIKPCIAMPECFLTWSLSVRPDSSRAPPTSDTCGSKKGSKHDNECSRAKLASKQAVLRVELPKHSNRTFVFIACEGHAEDIMCAAAVNFAHTFARWLVEFVLCES